MSTLEPRVFRRYGTLATLAVAVLGFMTPLGLVWYGLVGAVSLLALAIAQRAASVPEARILVVALLSVVVAVSHQPGSPEWLWRVQTHAGWWFATAALLRFSALYPAPLRAIDLGSGRGGRVGAFVAGVERFALRPTIVWSSAGVLALVGASHDLRLLRGFGGQLIDVLYGLSQSAWALAVVVALHFLTTGYRRADGSRRRRAWWMVAGLGSAMVALAWFAAFGVVPALLPGVPEGIMRDLGFVSALGLLAAPFLMVAGIACAIFYRGALDPALMVRRTTIVSAVGFVSIGVFATLENLLTDTVVRTLGLPSSSGAILAGAVIAIALATVHDRVRDWLTATGRSGARERSFAAGPEERV